MMSYCHTPDSLEGFWWLTCYLTTGTHLSFYWSFAMIILLLVITAPLALLLGFGGALASGSRIAPLRWVGKTYTNMIRGVPELIFFLFVPLALDQAFEYLRHKAICPADSGPVYQGNDFVVCAAAKLPLNSADEWIHSSYNFSLAVLAFAIVYGAFASNVLRGALDAVPKAQLETASSYGMNKKQLFWRVQLPQMWGYALPGLSNLWIILVKATAVLFLLGIQDIVYWARALGGTKTAAYYDYPHPDWRIWYFLALLVFHLLMTWSSGKVFNHLIKRTQHGQATLGGKSEIQVFAR